MALASSTSALFELDDGASPSELFATIEKFLKINFEELCGKLLSGKPSEIPHREFAAKEEFVLKLLLRRIGSHPTTAGKGDTQNVPIPALVLSEDFWTLLIYLFEAIPDDSLCQLLRERNFALCLDQCLKVTLQHIHAVSTGSRTQSNQLDHVETTPESARKKRKISGYVQVNEDASETNPSQKKSQTLILLIFHAVFALTNPTMVSAPQNPAKFHQNATMRIFNLRTDESASLVSNLLELVSIGLVTSSDSSCLKFITSIVLIWQHRNNETLSNDLNVDQLFTAKCLGWCLIILHLHHSNSSEHSVTLFSREERLLQHLIAVHSINPTRELFNASFVSSWRSAAGSLTWSQIEPLYNLLNPFFSHAIQLSEKLGVAGDKNIPAMLTQLFFDVAMRSVPRLAQKLAVNDRSWLESLFSVSMHISCPGLQKLQLESEELRVMTEGTRNPYLLGIDLLLETVKSYSLEMSPFVITYSAFAILKTTSEKPAWSLLAKTINLDVNVVVPNSGLSGAQGLLREICEHIKDSEESTIDNYITIKNEIIRPMMIGFVKARDIPGWITLWTSNLEYAMHERASKDHGFDKVNLSLVWEDPDLFSCFKDLVQALPNVSFAQSLSIDLIQRLENLDQRVGTTIDIFSRMAIAESVLLARPDDLTSNISTFEKLLNAIIIALNRQTDYQQQRWRLWTFLHRASMVSPSSSLSNTILKIFQSKHSAKLSLTSSYDIIVMPQGFARAARLREVLECFHFQVVQVASGDLSDETVLSMELTKLSEIILAPEEQDIQSTDQDSFEQWDGRTEKLQSLTDLTTACLSILMQYPKVLKKVLQATDRLLMAIISLSSELPLWAGTGQGLLDILICFLSIDEVTSDRYLSNTKYKGMENALAKIKSSHTFNDKLLLTLSIDGLGKSRAEWLASVIIDSFKSIESSNEAFSTLSCRLAVLDHLTRFANVSFGKPQNFLQLAEMCNLLQSMLPRQSPTDCRSILCSIERICDRSLERLRQENGANSNENIQNEIWSWCQSCIQNFGSLQVGTLQLILLRRVMQSFWHHTSSPGAVISKDEISQTRKLYFESLLQELRKIISSIQVVEDIWDYLANLLLALLDCEDLCKHSAAFRDITSHLEAALQKLEDETSPYPQQALSLLQDAQFSLQQLVQADDDTKHRSSDRHRLIRRLKHFLESVFEPVNSRSNTDISALTTRALAFVTSVQPSDFGLLMQILEDDLQQNRKQVETLLVLACIIDQMSGVQFTIDPSLARELHKIANGNIIQLTGSADALCLALDCTWMVLIYRSELVNQDSIDHLFGALAYTSALWEGIGISDDDCGTAAFQRICGIFGVLLGRYRKRLGGRYHLLLPVLQNLMRCLFYIGSESSAMESLKKPQSQFIRDLPQWLTASKVSLPPSSAEQFTRLLTSICDPTTSIVRKRKQSSGAELNDQTKGVRFVAGQYMQHLIIEYTKCSLNGRIKPEVKDRLMHGLYAVMDVMSRDLMRAMNAAMDSSSRAIFKTLYDDYQKHGKWNQH